MPTAYVLILGIAFLGPSPQPSGNAAPVSGALTSSEFATADACEAAGRHAQTVFALPSTRVAYFCTAK